MRTLLIAAIVAAPLAAHADPLSISAATQEAAPRMYVATGVGIGGVSDHTLLAVNGEVGVRVTDHLVLHGDALVGDDSELFGPQGFYRAFTGGVDATSCATRARVCVYAGLAAGFAQSESQDTNWFTGSEMSTNDSGPTALLRAGLDIGGKHVRWRPGIEASLVGPSAGVLTNSIAFTF